MIALFNVELVTSNGNLDTLCVIIHTCITHKVSKWGIDCYSSDNVKHLTIPNSVRNREGYCTCQGVHIHKSRLQDLKSKLGHI